MERLTRTDRRHAWGLGLAAAIATVLVATSPAKHWSVGPSKALLVGVFGVMCINMAVFTVNLLASMRRWRHSSTEEELAELAVSPMRGQLNAIGPRTLRASAFLLATCIGIIVGALAALLISTAVAP